MRDTSGEEINTKLLRKISVGWVVTLAVFAIVPLTWWVMGVIGSGAGHYKNSLNLFIARHFVGQVQSWALLATLGTLMLGVTQAHAMSDNLRYKRSSEDEKQPRWAKWLAYGIPATLLLVGVVLGFRALWDGDKDKARFYVQATEFVIPDIEAVPKSLEQLVDGAEHNNDELLTVHDTGQVVVREGHLPEDGWETRRASAVGAERILGESSGASQNTEVLGDTLAYIHENKTWTSIRDGSGTRVPIDGIAMWDGREDRASDCPFEGKSELNRALRGARSNSLNHRLFSEYPDITYDIADVYGICEDGVPSVVIPVSRYELSGAASIKVPAGLILVRGTESGNPEFERVVNVEPGTIPGPVYPLGQAEAQRQMHIWSAGREAMTRTSFGFEPSLTESQEGNASEFHLRALSDGRTYWVTPLTLRGSDSQLVVAYATIPADTVQSGQLNTLSIYVLPEDDRRAVSIESMARRSRDVLLQQLPQFVNNGGELREFMPGPDSSWTAFGVLDGAPLYMLTTHPGGELPSTLERLDGAKGFNSEATTESAIPDSSRSSPPVDLTSLTEEQLVQLGQDILTELQHR